MNFLDGLKTVIGGAVLVGGGVAGIAFGVIDPYTGVMMVGQGIAVWGIGAKLEKLIKGQKPVDLSGMKYVNLGEIKDETVSKYPNP